jgi:hypothetical protein
MPAAAAAAVVVVEWLCHAWATNTSRRRCYQQNIGACFVMGLLLLPLLLLLLLLLPVLVGRGLSCQNHRHPLCAGPDAQKQ